MSSLEIAETSSQISEISDDISACNTGDGADRTPRSRAFIFCLNNYTLQEIERLTEMDCLKYVFQEEIAPSTGTKHLQGCMYFKNQRKTKGDIYYENPRIHWELCRNWRRAVAYCSDPLKRHGKIWAKGVKVRPSIINHFDKYPPTNWQQQILSIIPTEPDDRKIYWIVDYIGGKGKTTFAKHLVLEFNALYLSSGKASDMKYIRAQNPDNTLIIIDLPRCCEDRVSYDGIECIKNGIFMSGKYESRTVVTNNPHVFVFSNFMPQGGMLSTDRLIIIEI